MIPQPRRPRAQRAALGRMIAVVIAAAVVAVVVRTTGSSPAQPSPAATSTTATAWALPSLDGNGYVKLSDYRGKPVVVTFFATWCTACRGELPAFVKAAQATKGRIQFVAVDSLETSDGGAFARSMGLEGWPLARDVDGAAASGLHDALGGTGMPITAFYSDRGALLFVAPGAVSATTLADDLNRFYGVAGVSLT